MNSSITDRASQNEALLYDVIKLLKRRGDDVTEEERDDVTSLQQTLVLWSKHDSQ